MAFVKPGRTSGGVESGNASAARSMTGQDETMARGLAAAPYPLCVARAKYRIDMVSCGAAASILQSWIDAQKLLHTTVFVLLHPGMLLSASRTLLPGPGNLLREINILLIELCFQTEWQAAGIWRSPGASGTVAG